MKPTTASLSPSAQTVITQLNNWANPENVAGMARFGIVGNQVLGISMPTLRAYAKELGKNHALALELWGSGIHEAQILASIIADPKQATPDLLEDWVKDFASWDVCDQTCMNFFIDTPFAHEKIIAWSDRPEEFVKRAAFALIACFANGHKRVSDDFYVSFFPLIMREVHDERNFVKKGVNWALRGIGKRNLFLNRAATDCAHELAKRPSKTARWIATDAIRDIARPAIIARLEAKGIR